MHPCITMVPSFNPWWTLKKLFIYIKLYLYIYKHINHTFFDFLDLFLIVSNLLLRRGLIHPWSRDQRCTVDPHGHLLPVQGTERWRYLGQSVPPIHQQILGHVPWKRVARDISEMERKMMESIGVSRWYELEIIIVYPFLCGENKKERICKINIEITLKIEVFVF